MRFTLNIDHPPEKMARSRARLEARARFQPTDRAPVGFCLVPRYFTPLFGLKYRDFFKDAETQYYWQLQFLKYPVNPAVAARNLGGKTLLWGNINPMLMLTGSKTEVPQAGRECLAALAPCGGFMLGDGANVCPGTPLENLAALTETATEYGAPVGGDDACARQRLGDPDPHPNPIRFP